jgi:CubicO group peptidase (beta-lactamase class C family)
MSAVSHHLRGDRELAAILAENQMRALVIAAPDGSTLEAGDTRIPNNLHSVRKSILSVLLGQLVDAGRLDLDMTIGTLGMDDDRTLTDAERSASVRDLLRSSSGVYLPLWKSDTPLPLEGPVQRPERGAYAPGAHMVYNNWDFNALGNIYERVSTKSIFLGFDRLIAGLLHMQDWDPFLHGAYQYRHDGLGGDRRFPNYRFQLSARDLLRLGRMMLAGGTIDGEQIVSRDWIKESTAPLVSTDEIGPQESYGYLWWVSQGNGTALPAGSFSAYGMGGQFLTVIPERQLVLVGLIDTSVAFADLSFDQREDVYARMLDLAETAS